MKPYAALGPGTDSHCHDLIADSGKGKAVRLHKYRCRLCIEPGQRTVQAANIATLLWCIPERIRRFGGSPQLLRVEHDRCGSRTKQGDELNVPIAPGEGWGEVMRRSCGQISEAEEGQFARRNETMAWKQGQEEFVLSGVRYRHHARADGL